MPEPQPEETRTLLQRLRDGDASVEDILLPRVYDDLRAIARRRMADQKPSHTLQATALVHEAWLKVAEAAGQAENRTQFLRIAASAMRSVLVDHARAKGSRKRGGDRKRIAAELAQVACAENPGLVLDVDEALVKLAALDPQLAKIAECRFFGGLQNDEIADSLGVSTRTVERGWRTARAWLQRELDGEE
ncbi:MAG: ECF-type sigma factor [Planctomycetota bacterium]